MVTAATAPFAVSLRRRSPEEVALLPAPSLDPVLRDLPGLWIQDRHHFALGERISVRGLGWRAAWGVRGIQVLLDGVPLTQPDGQAVLDVVAPATIRRVEFIRGPSSRFWGNGAGGVLLLSTARPYEETTLEAAALRVRMLGGSYGTRQLLAGAGVSLGEHYVQAYASSTRQDGFRAHSEGRLLRAGGRAEIDLGPRIRLRISTAFVRKSAENPSALTREQLEKNPRMARPGFVRDQAGETSMQAQLGLRLTRRADIGQFSAAAYGLARALDNPLPFAVIGLSRRTVGARLTFRRQRGRLEWGLATGGAFQRDGRTNFNNNGEGEPGAMRQLDQLETVTNVAASGFARLGLTERLWVSLGLRASRVRFESDDRLIESPDPATRGDQSGARTFVAYSPSVGLSYQTGPALLFANYTTSFQTPTTTELVNRPDATGGFNPRLEPQKARGVEVGARGVWPAARLEFNVALFRLRTRDALVQTGTSPKGRAFYGNASESLNRGLEVAVTWQPAEGAELRLSYTGSRFVYAGDIVKQDTTLDVSGHHVPGIPAHRFYAGLTVEESGWWGRLQAEAVSDLYVNDENTAESDGYVVFDLHVGHEGLAVVGAQVQPFAAVRNLFDVRYNGSVIVNAYGGRYYEPAPGRTFTAGVNLVF